MRKATLIRGLGALALAALWASPALAQDSVFTQCPGDTDGDGVVDHPTAAHPRARCMSLSAGDGFSKMSDGTRLYTFGFHNITGVRDTSGNGTIADEVMAAGMLGAEQPAPTLAFDQDDEVFLTLTNVGMLKRPDLFDAHSVHWHGFPNAASVFDGVPDASISINMAASLTYYYNVKEEGTYLYHCHVEAAEHMQMGMIGNLYVRPRQNRLAEGTNLAGWIHHTGQKYAYNDGDGSTRYDVEQVIQLGGFDGNFHEQHEAVQPLPFADMATSYAMINGRGYPDTINPNSLYNGGDIDRDSQKVHSRVEATAGQRILLRISNVDVTRFFTLGLAGLPMRVVGSHARLRRGPGGADLSYTTQSLDLGGGESTDVIVDTTGATPGTYLLYTTNLNYLSNPTQDFGGMLTEIVVR